MSKQYDLDLPAHLLTEQVQTDIYKQASSGIVDYGQLSPITELIMQFQSLCSGMNQTLSSLQQTVNELVEDKNKALDLLDKAGVWTGADLLVHDRVASLIRDWQEQQRKIIALQAEVGHLKTEANNNSANTLRDRMLKQEQDEIQQEAWLRERLKLLRFPVVEDVYVTDSYYFYVTFARLLKSDEVMLAGAVNITIERTPPLRNRYRVVVNRMDKEEE